MNISNKIFIILSILFYTININPTDIRVLLPRPQITNPATKTYTFHIKSDDGFILKTQTHQDKNIIVQQNELTIKIDPQNIYLLRPGKKTVKTENKSISFSAEKENLFVNGVPYQGKITIHNLENTGPILVNTLDLEDYVYGVLPAEMYQYWPLEVQKVQAIATRGYAVYQMNQAKRNDCLYDIKNTNFHQTYNGTHSYSHIREAVDETAGMVLFYNNKVAIPMFDSCCGGIIPAKTKGTNFQEAPYLARHKKCDYCQNFSRYCWSKTLTAHEILRLLSNYPKLKDRFKNFKKLKGLKIVNKDEAGLVHKVLILGDKTNVYCSGKEFWMAFKKYLFSQNFSFSKPSPNKITISGHGYGHQLGLCQQGAYELVQNGWNFKEILKFYYPGTTIKKFETQEDDE